MTLFAWQDAACGRWQVRGSERDVRRVAQGRRLQAQPLRRAFACRDAHRLPAHVRLLPRSMVKCPASQQPMQPPAAAGAHRLRRPERRALAAWAPKRGRRGALVPSQSRSCCCLRPPRPRLQRTRAAGAGGGALPARQPQRGRTEGPAHPALRAGASRLPGVFSRGALDRPVRGAAWPEWGALTQSG